MAALTPAVVHLLLAPAGGERHDYAIPKKCRTVGPVMGRGYMTKRDPVVGAVRKARASRSPTTRS